MVAEQILNVVAIIGILIGLIGMVVGFYIFFYVHYLWFYLKKHKPERWSSLVGSYLILEQGPIKTFRKQITYLYGNQDIRDQKIMFLKKKIRKSLTLAAILFVAFIVTFPIALLIAILVEAVLHFELSTFFRIK